MKKETRVRVGDEVLILQADHLGAREGAHGQHSCGLETYCIFEVTHTRWDDQFKRGMIRLKGETKEFEEEIFYKIRKITDTNGKEVVIVIPINC